MVAFVVAGLATRAHAAGVVLEAVVGTRAVDADAPTARLRDALAREGFLATPDDVRNLIDARVSHASAPRTDDVLATLSRQIDDGYAAFLQGSFSLALERLPLAIEAFHASPAIAARDQTKRDLIFKALVGIALAHGRLRHEAASLAAMEELARSFADRDFNRTLYGPEAHDLFRKARARLERRGRGALDVKVDGAGAALIFVNERYEGVGAIHKGDLLPGTYRVYTQLGSQPGRVHRVDVKAGEAAAVTVDWVLSATVRTDTWVGLLFSDDHGRSTREARIAGALARSLGEPMVAVIALEHRGARRTLTGRVYDAAGRQLRNGAVPLADAEQDPRKVEALARLLAGHAGPGQTVASTTPPATMPEAPAAAPPAPGDVATVTASPAAIPASKEPRRGSSSSARPWAWASVGLGLVAAGAGAYFLSIDGDCIGDEPCAEFKDTRTPGLLLVGGGGALVATGILLFFVGGSDDGDRAVTVAPTRDGVAVHGAWSF